MTKESYALLTGLFVIVLGAALIGISTFLGSYGIVRDTYIVVTTDTVSGLNAESTVIYRGVAAGKVTAIDFDPQDVRNILVKIEINRGLPITQGTFATLRTQGLTGLAQVELNDKGENPEPLQTRPDDPARIPLRPSLLDRLTESGEDLLPKLTQLADQLNSVVGAENRSRVQAILTSGEIAARDLVALEKRANDVLTSIPALTRQAGQSLSEISTLTDDFRVTSKHVRDAADSTASFAQSGRATSEAMQTIAKQLLPRVETLIGDLQRTTDQIRRFSATVENDPQALLLGHPTPNPGPGEPGHEESP
ncbi:MlaD family protein [Methylotetracoccus oryzae]|uniref:MlaD family protein n=1 Tax=Methylotetracoccus oryzae TaxID=1919059 RepID=UPI00111B59D5|nr:MlaD family protein [Methylotetracoccus oryzae]